MSDTTVTIYDRRLTSGVYSSIAQDIRRLGTAFLGAASFNQQFVRVAPKWPPHFSYKPKGSDASKEYRCILFGEIASGALGTVLCAAGNHVFEGADNMLVHLTDDSKSRDILAMICPQKPTAALRAMFNNQLATLGEIRAFDEEEERMAQKTPYVKDFVRSSNPDAPDAVADMFVVHLPVKYQKNGGGSGTATAFKRFQKQTVYDDDDAEDSSPPGAPPKDACPTAGTDFHVPTGEEVHVGACYDPRLLYDYRGPAFKLVNNKLIQHDIRDINDQLITPWAAYEELRPGTLVLVEATIHCFRFNVNGKRERKVYQLHAERVNVLATSDTEVEIRIPPVIPPHLQPATPSPVPAIETPEDASAAFANFRKRKAISTADSDTGTPTKAAKPDESETKIDKGKKPVHEDNAAGPSKLRRAGRKSGNNGEGMDCDN
ncbi:hypothetical protein CVT26_007673 [Gymnopilus dilepis]|uniref:Uncharacterized protein n=1 Tax=Gymnopilus dilepis TaxID=231916 RepID=A0A409WT87_9AGAR|nr:hypothetical protein CVT26_007673 [Gymnopilus dilepis]